jgi:hypothetical protein
VVTLPQTLRRTIERHPLVRKTLLGCGVVSSVLYVATDVLATLRYDGYSYTDQVFSELTAEGSPTRVLMVAANGIPYTVLVAACAVGVWASAGPKRAARVTGALLLGYAAAGFAGGVLFPMTTRGTEATLRNVMHIPATIVMSLFILLAMGFGATLLNRRFRYYSYETIVILVVFGVWTGLQGGRIADNQPTPWAGLEERTNIYATLLWLAVLAVGLLRAQSAAAPRQLREPAATPQGMQRVAR